MFSQVFHHICYCVYVWQRWYLPSLSSHQCVNTWIDWTTTKEEREQILCELYSFIHPASHFIIIVLSLLCPYTTLLYYYSNDNYSQEKADTSASHLFPLLSSIPSQFLQSHSCFIEWLKRAHIDRDNKVLMMALETTKVFWMNQMKTTASSSKKALKRQMVIQVKQRGRKQAGTYMQAPYGK